MPDHDQPTSTRPFTSLYHREAAAVLRAVDAGTATLEDVDLTLTDGVAHALELQAQLRRLRRGPWTPSIRARAEAMCRRLEELEEVVVRLREHRNAMAARIAAARLSG